MQPAEELILSVLSIKLDMYDVDVFVDVLNKGRLYTYRVWSCQDVHAVDDLDLHATTCLRLVVSGFSGHILQTSIIGPMTCHVRVHMSLHLRIVYRIGNRREKKNWALCKPRPIATFRLDSS